MKELDKEKMGLFIAQLRREKEATQKELADRLYVSDKAVSKWERGLSVPDISLLLPLAEILGVTTTELLRGERFTKPQLEVEQVEELVAGAIHLTQGEQRKEEKKRRLLWKGIWILCAIVAAVQVGFLWAFAIPVEALETYVLLVEGLTLGFSGFFCFFAKEHLPDYYDNNAISAYSDGIFRMNLPGVRLTNQNWPHIINVGRCWLLAVSVVFPGLYLLVRRVFPGNGELAISLFASLSFFIPMIWVGKRYE